MTGVKRHDKFVRGSVRRGTYLLIGLGHPVPAGVGCMDLINEDDLSRLILPKLILGVYQYQAPLSSQALAQAK